ERDRKQDQHQLESTFRENVEVGRLPLGDEVLLNAGELRLAHVAVEMDAVGVDDSGHDAGDEDQHEVARPAFVDVAVDASYPVHRLDECGNTDRNQAEKESTVQVGPRD